MEKPIVSLKGIGKKYRLIHHKLTFLDGFLARDSGQDIWAVKDIDLDIKRGDRVGIYGHNGSGKSTLLRIISGLTTPTQGKVLVDGRVVSLANLEAGFHPELTGQENIYLNGALVGMSKRQIENKFNGIVEYSGIGEFIDVPFYTYSDGMKFRLAFSLAVSGEFDILIMDEVFVSGDMNFQQKVIKTIGDIQNKKGITTIVCSHIPGLIMLLSNKYYELKHGNIFKRSKKDVMQLIKSRKVPWSIRFL